MSEEAVVDSPVVPEAIPETVATPAENTQDQPEVKTEDAPKTFTQEQLNEIVAREKAKAAAIADRRALKAYRETLERILPQQQQPTEQPKDGRPTRAQYEHDDDYVEAMADWKIAQREQAQRQQAAQMQARTIAEKTESIYAEASKIQGFDRDAFDELPLTPAIAAAIVDSEVSAKLMHYMAANPSEVEKISRMPPARQAAAIGALEVKMNQAPKASNAPEPIKPISGRTGGEKDPSEMTDAEFAAWRKRQIAQRR